MPDSMYDGDESEAAPAPEESESKEQESGEETALLPKSFFAGKELKPGTKCQIEIVHGYGDEVEVKYVPHGTKEEPKHGMEMSMRDKIAMAAT